MFTHGILQLCLALLAAPGVRAERIEVKAPDFVTTHYLTAAHQDRIRKTNILRGEGAAEYSFRVKTTGWY